VRVLEGKVHALRVADAEIVVAAPLDLDVPLPTRAGRRPGALRDAVLAPAAVDGALGGGAYPVHRALLVGTGLEDAAALGRFTAAVGDESNVENALVRLVIVREGAAGSQDAGEHAGDGWVSLLDVDAASGAIESLRASTGNAVQYERAWFASGAASLTDWIYSGTKGVGALRPVQKSFITAVLADTAARIDVAEEDMRSPQRRVSEEKREDLLQAVREWSIAAHKELGTLFADRGEWAGLSWWKLAWKVDDVGMLATDVLEKTWLVSAERELVGLGGLFRGAGVVDKDGFGPNAWDQPEVTVEGEEKIETTERNATLSMQPANGPTKAIYSASSTPNASSTPANTPYPLSLTNTRATLSSQISALQSLANTHLLTFLSTSSLSTALSALIYISSPPSTIYESFTIAAFGIAFGAWRMASKWTQEKKTWEEQVREEGRKSLLESEDVLLRALEQSKSGVDQKLLTAVEEGREAVQEGWDALARMGE
jgi:hypothetical protein